MKCMIVSKHIGQYLAVLNGADAIIFTAGIGENSVHMRDAVISGFLGFGCDVDPEKNVFGAAGDISTDETNIQYLAIPTGEELVIARDVERLKKIAAKKSAFAKRGRFSCCSRFYHLVKFTTIEPDDISITQLNLKLALVQRCHKLSVKEFGVLTKRASFPKTIRRFYRDREKFIGFRFVKTFPDLRWLG